MKNKHEIKKVVLIAGAVIAASAAYAQGVGTVKLMNWEAEQYRNQRGISNLTANLERAIQQEALRQAQAQNAEKQNTESQEVNPYRYVGREGHMIASGEYLCKLLERQTQEKNNAAASAAESSADSSAQGNTRNPKAGADEQYPFYLCGREGHMMALGEYTCYDFKGNEAKTNNASAPDADSSTDSFASNNTGNLNEGENNQRPPISLCFYGREGHMLAAGEAFWTWVDNQKKQKRNKRKTSAVSEEDTSVLKAIFLGGRFPGESKEQYKQRLEVQGHVTNQPFK